MEEKKQSKQQESFVSQIGRKKISYQMCFAYIMAIVLPITVLGVFMMRTTYLNQKNYHADLLESYNTGVKRTMYEIASQIYTFSESIVYNDELIAFLRGSMSRRKNCAGRPTKSP